jgi:ubiquitin-conjugating enzyme E2 O
VGLGQTVLFCDDNGAKIPEVPSLGQVDPPVDGREGFRQELSKIDRAQVFLPKGDSGKAQWWGEVVDQYLDGTVCVEVYSGERKVVDIKQLIVLNEAEEPFPGDEMDDGASFMSDKSWETMSEDEQPYSAWDGGENGYSVEDMEVDGDDDDAQSAADAEAVDRDTQMPEATPSPIARVRQLAPESPVAASRTTTTTTGIHASPATSPKAGPSSPRASTSTSSRPPLADSEKWARFEMLEEAPAEHYYYPEPVMPAAKAYHSRLMKEHRALASSLPDNILVRTYEDRADLMRVLIVGPEGTPYADAPFVFDVYLNPTKFPFEPPLVYFHSHTNGLGRCNRE